MATSSIQEVPELPTLDGRIHLLETDSRASGVLQSLVLDTLLTRETPMRAVWVDGRGNESIQSLARFAPSMRVPNRIEIAKNALKAEITICMPPDQARDYRELATAAAEKTILQ